jgi:hypothetical protein
MPNFQENLNTLENTDAFASMKLFGESGGPEADIENKPGSQGSFRVYYHVAKKWGGIGPKAAQEALTLFAEHAADARANPGKHPNIDRLFEVIEKDIYFAVRCYPAE